MVPPAVLSLSILASLVNMTNASPTQTIRVNNHPVSVSLAAATTKLIVGEPVTLTFSVANQTADEMYVVSGPIGNGATDGFTVTVTGPAGPLAPVPPNPMASNGATGASSLAARSTFVDRLLLAEWVKIDKPGRYTITVARKLRVGVMPSTNWSKAQAFDVRLDLAIDVAVGTQAQLGAVIDRLGTKMLAASEDDGGSIAEALATIHDARVVPYFIKALALDWSRQFPAIRALGSYPTADSLAALVRMLAATDFNTRISAAQAIADHKSDAGLKALWAVRKDSNASLRLEVLHAVARMNPPDAVARLTEMSRDSSPMVSGEAKRYLAERKP